MGGSPSCGSGACGCDNTEKPKVITVDRHLNDGTAAGYSTAGGRLPPEAASTRIPAAPAESENRHLAVASVEAANQVICRSCGNTGKDFTGKLCTCEYGKALRSVDAFPGGQCTDGARAVSQDKGVGGACDPIEEEPDQEKVGAQGADKLPECVNIVAAEDTEQPEDDIMSDPDRLSPEKQQEQAPPPPAPYLPDYDDYDDEEDEDDTARGKNAKTGCFCCRRKAGPAADEGRCARGTMAPISLGQNGQQVSLEKYLQGLEEKRLTEGEDGVPKGGFAV